MLDSDQFFLRKLLLLGVLVYKGLTEEREGCGEGIEKMCLANCVHLKLKRNSSYIK